MGMKKKERLHYIGMSILAAAISCIIIVPFLIMILGSLKNPAEAQVFNLSLPTEWKFDNYSYVIQAGGVGKAMMNSMIVTVSVTLIVLLAGGLCAFVISRRSSRYTRFVYYLLLLGMISPLQVVTTFGLLKMLNLMGTYVGVIMIITAVQLPWSCFTLTSFIKSVPRDLDEAAFIDGVTPIKLYFQVIHLNTKAGQCAARIFFKSSSGELTGVS